MQFRPVFAFVMPLTSVYMVRLWLFSHLKHAMDVI